jgi:hypothetical protein
VRWKGPEEHPEGWRLDINAGININTAHWERMEMFPVKKIVGNVEMGNTTRMNTDEHGFWFCF